MPGVKTWADLPAKESPAADDIIPIRDTVAGVKKKITWSQLPGSGGGEANTSSNLGTGGEGLYASKSGVDLQFKKLQAASSKVTVVANGDGVHVDLDVVPAQIPPASHGNEVHTSTFITSGASLGGDFGGTIASATHGTARRCTADANEPTSDQKAALAGTSGVPSGTNKYVTNDDARNTNARTATVHDLGGALHNTDTLANLNTKISDGPVVKLAGQLGGTAAIPDVRGLRESGGQLLTMAAVADGQYLLRSGTTITSGSPGGGATPAWKGSIVAAHGEGDPNELLMLMQQGPDVVNATPTNITATVARCCYFKLDTAITFNKVRWYGVGAVSAIYHVAIYRDSDGARMTADLEMTTTANAWNSVGSALNVPLAANVLYFIAWSADTTGTTAGVRCFGPTFIAATSLIGVVQASWPGNLAMSAAKFMGSRYAQFAVTAGALPATAGSRVVQAAWTGGMGAFFLDNNNA